MADCLEKTAENVERALGEAITARSIAIDYYSGLGPPDLCCLNKVFVRAWLPPDPKTLPPTGCVRLMICSTPFVPSSLLRCR